MGKDANTIKHEIEQTRERMGDTVEALGYKADIGSRLRDGVQDRVESAKDSIGEAFASVKTAVAGASDAVNGAVGDSVHSGATSMRSLNQTLHDRVPDVDLAAGSKRALGMARENPIGLALVGMALGVLAGSLVPVSDVERERLGPVRQKVVDQAQAAGKDLVAAGKAVIAETAQSVVSTARSSAQTHGQEVIDAAKARAEGSSAS